MSRARVGVVYTIGHSTRSIEELVGLLRRFGIEVVVDIRRFPTSRRCPWFGKEELMGALAREGLGYRHIGDLLGGYRTGGYEAYTRTAAYREGVRRLLEVAGQRRAAILCSERFPWKCHRRFVARTLEGMGIPVVHIIGEGRTWMAKGSRRLVGERIAKSLEGRAP
ncbi:TPA: DUF488 domain-containing protein [Candidatus Bathyarchaeota archaeon]|nr:DUF488 domain-containing protein [Candidatus Bathyarchaeota archaeon]